VEQTVSGDPYKVVCNDEEQYSIWWLGRDNPPGWRDAGASGTKAECLAWIERVWTDMRPASARRVAPSPGVATSGASSEVPLEPATRTAGADPI
jgi:MbtH protein